MKCIFGVCNRTADASVGVVCRYHFRNMTRKHQGWMRTAWRAMAKAQRKVILVDQKQNPAWKK